MFVKLVSKVKDPLLIKLPAVAAVYQSIVSPAPGVAPTVILPGPHLDALTATGATGITTFDVIVILDIEVQPLALVAVTVYVPGTIIVAFALLPRLLFHE